MEAINNLHVFYHGRKVGQMALYKERLAAFQYEKSWLGEGFSISPFSLPLKEEVFMPKIQPFDGIFGVFADSLPDGWGRLLVDRVLARNRLDPYEVGPLDRLAIVGDSGMGGLTYRPVHEFGAEEPGMDLDEMARECSAVLQSAETKNLDELFRLGGSSGGARPKSLMRVNGEEWIIKFPSTQDRKEIGKQEYDYSLCAKKCGIQMTETKLFPSRVCAGYFGTKRFDRLPGADGQMGRVHMVSVSGLLETSHRMPNLDYDVLMKLTLELTKDFAEIEKLFRLMCFNVFAHNRDDHSKNFTYLYEETENRWVLSPAYDLTYSYSLGGEHATTVHGNGKDPGRKDILSVARAIGMDGTKARRIADDIEQCVRQELKEYLKT